jgi:hypothetical protein
MSDNGRRRLTSWKEIAAHLGRDVRTVLRWEKDRGLPVHRAPGATGRVVFAFTDELDAWSHGPLTKPSGPVVPESAEPTPSAPRLDVAAEPALAPARASRSRTFTLAAALVVVSAVSFAIWRIASPKDGALTVSVTEPAIVAIGDGGERWRHAFAPGEKAISVGGRPAGILDDGSVLVATAYTDGHAGTTLRGGELFRFSAKGRVQSRFAFDDPLKFGGGPYGPPWGISDYRAHGTGAARRVAVAAHHLEWWPSVVTILDHEWQRRGTFVNAGWVERLHWISADRLMIAGFSNAFDGGMVGILDAAAIDGQSPADNPTYTCMSCGPGGPLRYIILPRSEVNLVTASPFNRVILAVKPDTVVARTIEVPAIAQAADALYEFTPSLDLIRASYSDRYWELHRELESQGKISHTRQQCPDRNGPREIRVWEPESGWSSVPTAPSRAPSSPAQTRR